MTGFAQEDQVVAALEDGAFAILSKPFDVQHAVETVTKAARLPIVLVVEDSGPVRDALSAAGLRVKSATCGEDALRALGDGDVDVCVMEVATASTELAKQLREQTPGVTIIGVAASDAPEMLRDMAAHGMYTFLKKPLDPRALVRAIATARGANEAERAKLLAKG
jgi:DNA-binding NtrC family response regulator